MTDLALSRATTLLFWFTPTFPQELVKTKTEGVRQTET